MKRKTELTWKVLVLSLITALGVQGAYAAPGGLAQQVPLTGRLIDSSGQIVSDGDYRLRIRVFDDQVAGTQQFEELFDGTTDYGSGACQEVSVQDGYFRVELGECNQLTEDAFRTLYNNTTIYTEISLDFDRDGTYEEVFSPRRRMSLAAGAVSALQLVSTGNGVSTNSLYVNENGHLNFDGVGDFGIGIGGTDPSSTIQAFENADTARLALEGNGDGTNYASVVLQGGGTAWNIHHRQIGVENGNFSIEEFDGTTFSSRLVIEPGGNVGIGVADPGYRLSVGGVIESTTGGFRFPDGTTQTTAATGGGGVWSQNGSEIYYTTGPVGIGTNDPDNNVGLEITANDAGVFDALRIQNSAGSGQSQISFEENGQGQNFRIRYNGAENDLEFVGLGGNVAFQLDRDTGNADVQGDLTVNGNIIDGDNTNFYIDPNGTSEMVTIQANTFFARADNNFYVDPDSISHLSDVRAGIYYDRDNTSYYVNPASTSIMNDVRANIFYDRQNTSFYIHPASTSRTNVITTNSLNWGTRGSLVGGNASIELGGGGTPYIDFSNDTSVDFDMRIILCGNDCLQAIGGNFVHTSDRTLKTNIQEVSGVLDRVNQLQAVSFNWIDSPNGRISSGYIAQDVQNVFPELVTLSEANNKLALDYNGMIPILSEAIKELDARTSAIESPLSIDDIVGGLASRGVTFSGLTLTGDGRVEGDLVVEGDVQVGGALRENVKTVTKDYEVLSTDAIVYADLDADSQSNSLNINLTTSDEENPGRSVRIRFIGESIDKVRSITYQDGEGITPQIDQTYEFILTENGWLPI